VFTGGYIHLPADRYHRQTLLPQIGQAGQDRLGRATVLLVGCGALCTVLAEQLARAGVGRLRIIDRDVVELSNLQRQTLFDQTDAAESVPKAVAAERRLKQVNSAIAVEAVVTHFDAVNAEELAGLVGDRRRVDLILDGTDNVETRYLLNDLAVKHGLPWVYGACVGTEGRVMAIRAGVTPCLRCLFPEPPGAGALPTCDTAGVLGPLAGVVASLQAVAALKLLTGNESAIGQVMTVIDVWSNRLRTVDVSDARRPDCPTCARNGFDALDGVIQRSPVSLCGRNAVQVRPQGNRPVELGVLAKRLEPLGAVTRTPYLLRLDLRKEQQALELTIFADGRLIVKGTTDANRARALYARYVGI
jgi:molybdopterin-synthase adenylyltransferase